MAELPASDEVYRLAWLGGLRYNRKRRRHEVLTRFVGHATLTFQDRWLAFDRMPILALGSRWQRQRAMPDDTEIRALRPNLIGPFEPVLLTASNEWRRLLDPFLGQQPLAAAAGLWLMESVEGEYLALPVSELIRSHYVFDPLIVPSVQAGLSVLGKMSSRTREYWVPDATHWKGPAGEIAQLQVRRGVEYADAYRLARLLFSGEGRRGLAALFHACQRASSVEKRTASPRIVRLPEVATPYSTGATWHATTGKVGPDELGRYFTLILQLRQHSGEVPWQTLEVQDAVGTRLQASGPRTPTTSKPTTARVLDPLPRNPTTLSDGGSDARFRPLRARDLCTTDDDADAFGALRPVRAPDSPSRGGRKSVRQVDSAATQFPDKEGAGTPLVLPGKDQAEPQPVAYEQSFDIRPLFDAVQRRLEELCDTSDAVVSRYLPDRETVYSFVVPAAGRTLDPRVKPRRFLVMEVAVGGRAVCLLDPVRRHGGEHHPIGVARLHGCRRWHARDVEAMARHFEYQRRRGRSWTTKGPLLPSHVAIVGVVHPPANEEWHARLPAVVNQLAAAVIQLADGAAANKQRGTP
jgi:hypothetical protein